MEPPTVHLASASPRRRLLLEQAGIPVRVVRSGLDDGRMTPGPVPVAHWTMALAYLKARAGQHASLAPGLFLGADTMVVAGGHLMGQPKDAPDARRMIRELSSGAHEVVTGVALVWSQNGAPRRLIFADVAQVHVGDLSSETIDAYVESGEWRGKAGAYNLMERVDAGWPIEWDGDPASIMGLPMVRLRPMLERILGADQATTT